MEWKCASMHSARNFFDSPNRLWAALTALEFYLVLHRAPMFSFFSGLQIIWHQVTLWLSIRTWKCICETVHIQFRVHPRFEYKVPVIQIKGLLYQNSQKVFVFKFIILSSLIWFFVSWCYLVEQLLSLAVFWNTCFCWLPS